MNRATCIEAIRKRLTALDCPFSKADNLRSQPMIVKIVSWLEDQCIRLYEIADREPLRTNDNNWNEAFNKYLEELCCPCLDNGYSKENQLQCLLWLVSHAVSVEYEDNHEKFNAIPMETELSSEEEHQLEVLRSWLLKIAKLLNVSIVDENEISAILDILIEEIKSIKSQIKDGKLQPLKWSLSDLPITGETSDLKLKDAMCVLECLYNEDVREIQDKINYIIEQVQMVTANPKTQGNLGVVGV